MRRSFLVHMDVADDKVLTDEDVETVRLEILNCAESQQAEVLRSTGPRLADLEMVKADWTVRLVPLTENAR